jgi:carboxylesterase
VFNKSESTVPLEKVTDLAVKQGPIMKWCEVEAISVETAGQSMGGAIALQMAAEQRVDACAVAAPALRLTTNAEILIPLLSWASFTLTSNLQQDFYLPCYDFYHSRALRALWQVCRQARNSLTEITCPVYAAHSHNDTTIPSVVMDWLQRDVSDLTYQWFDQSNHVLTRDVDGDEVCRQVAEFLGKMI